MSVCFEILSILLHRFIDSFGVLCHRRMNAELDAYFVSSNDSRIVKSEVGELQICWGLGNFSRSFFPGPEK